jgi:putative spermidine/putrescine transport system ATP-binding protein
VAVMLDGRLQQYDTPDVLYARPATEALARFFGGQTFVPGVVDGAVFRSALGALAVEGLRPGPGVMTIRPEGVRLGEGACNTRAAVVTARSFTGAQTQLRVQVGEVGLTVALSPDIAAGIAVGQTVPITLPPQNLWVMEG